MLQRWWTFYYCHCFRSLQFCHSLSLRLAITSKPNRTPSRSKTTPNCFCFVWLDTLAFFASKNFATRYLVRSSWCMHMMAADRVASIVLINLSLSIYIYYISHSTAASVFLSTIFIALFILYTLQNDATTWLSKSKRTKRLHNVIFSSFRHAAAFTRLLSTNHKLTFCSILLGEGTHVWWSWWFILYHHDEGE